MRRIRVYDVVRGDRRQHRRALALSLAVTAFAAALAVSLLEVVLR